MSHSLLTEAPYCEFCHKNIFVCDCPRRCLVCEAVHKPSEDCRTEDLLDVALDDLD
jgi:hypothetical protein